MHHALEIQEILLNIFSHCYSWFHREDQSDLVSLARTCRAFKEPALDVLWEELCDLSPLMECLPEATQLNIVGWRRSLSRPLTQTEWVILQSYTRRVRSILDFGWGLDEKSIVILSDPPTTKFLFPNLRHMRINYLTERTRLLHLPIPSLISLWVRIEDPRWFRDSLGWFPESSQNVTRLSLYVGRSDVAFNKLVSYCICRWRNLQTVICPEVSLDMDALSHLSRMPALTHLIFKLTIALPDCISSHFFSNLLCLTIRSPSLCTISQLLSRVRLPTIKSLSASIDNCPSRQELSSFLTSVRTSDAGHTLNDFSLHQSTSSSNIVRPEGLQLCLADLQPCMEFSNLRRIGLNIKWNVDLTDSDLLALASAWPHLENLVINPDWGWNMLGGITPNGLVQLLQRCRSLDSICLAMDTRGYTESPPTGANFGLTLPHEFCFDVLDSVIEAESVPAIVGFFTAMEPCTHFFLRGWSGRGFVIPPGWDVYKARWDDVSGRIKRCSVR